jgi:hypothetical protein
LACAFTIHLSVRLLLRVLKPRVGWPHGVTGCRPPEVFAFAAAVRVIDRIHRNAAIVRALAQPALAPGLAERNVFVIDVAHLPDGRHAIGRTRRISPEGSFSSAMPPSRETNCACVPAERAICAPLPGFSSMLCTTVPAGMFFSGSALPTRMSASGPDITVRPDLQPVRRRM